MAEFDKLWSGSSQDRITGQITLAELEGELSEIYCREWPWQIRELEMGKFLVRFPPHKKVADIKNYPSFNLRKEGVQVEVLDGLGTYQNMVSFKKCGFRSWVSLRDGVTGKFLHK